MNKSDGRLKTIESDQNRKRPHSKPIIAEQKKNKKQSTRKISLKQSMLNQHRDINVPQLHPKVKTTQQINLQNDQKYKIIKQLEILTRPSEQHRKGSKISNLSKHNKSLIFSQHKLGNPHQSSTLKASKVFPSESNEALTKTKQKNQSYTNKKSSLKGSTTKKHSKSVYNYTEFDEYPQGKRGSKKDYNKQSSSKNSRQLHNKSALTQQGHHISTSSITKRANKSKDILKKLLNNGDIKKKTSDFKVLSNCLRTYLKEEELQDNKIDVGQIIKIVKAFNKAEISKMSKPLEQLISEIIELIQDTVQRQKQVTHPTLQNQPLHKYQTPQRMNQTTYHGHSSSKNRPNVFGEGVNENPSDISKTKKVYPQEYVNAQNYNDTITEQKYHSSPSKDLIKLEYGLQELRSESKLLKRFIDESSGKKSCKEQMFQKLQSKQKRVQIEKLKRILQKQKLILEKVDVCQDSQRGSNSSEESSLKCYPPVEQ